MEIIKGIEELIEKSRKYRQARIDLDMAEMELNCVDVERILNPYLNRKVRVTKNGSDGHVDIVEGILYFVAPSRIYLDNAEWLTPHNHIFGEGRQASFDREDIINVELV